MISLEINARVDSDSICGKWVTRDEGDDAEKNKKSEEEKFRLRRNQTLQARRQEEKICGGG